jgi:outer membrane protein OmpA-like peptidoglycan-associated protein
MRRDLGIIAGATAAAAALVFAATQSRLVDRRSPEPGAPAAAEAVAPPAPVGGAGGPPVAPVAVADWIAPAPPGPPPELQAEITRLAARLEQRQAEFAALQATLADRDVALAARDAELRSLRAELDTLRERFAFEVQLAAMKPGDRPAPAAAGVDAMLVNAAATAALDEAPMTAIHFETGSARLTPGGLAHAAAAAVTLAGMSVERVRLDGYADRTGSPARNRALAEARARAVADFLIAAGLPADMMQTAGTIEPGRLPVATGPGEPEPLNRAVTITPVPPPTT